MIPLSVPDLSGNETRYLLECIATNFVSSVGEFVQKFEVMVAEAAGSLTAAATSSGTTGLHVSLVAAGVQRDDLVLLPSFTFIASANAVSHSGALPWLIDIDPETWTMDPDLLSEALQKETRVENGNVVHAVTGRRVGAIMPVYTLGTPADMNALGYIARQYGLPIIADGAAAIGARYLGQNLSNLADLTVFSFNGNKTVTCGGGGAVVGNTDLVSSVKHLSSTARCSTEYHHDQVGFNYRMTNIQAAVGCAQMERLDQMIGAKRHIRNQYDEVLSALPGVKTFPQPKWAESACWLSGILLPENIRISDACGFLQNQGIEARSFWKPVHMQPPYSHVPRSLNGVSERLWERVLILPCSTSLTKRDQDYAISVVKKLVGLGTP